MRAWLNANFPGFLDGMDGPSEQGKVDVRVSCTKWWYYSDDLMPADEEHDSTFDLKKKKDAYNAGRTSIADDEVLQRLAVNHRCLNPDGSFKLSIGHSMRSSMPSDFNADQILYFNLIPIIKRQNHRKHNSHQWFFDSICDALDSKVEFAFLTDCGTTYNVTCIARLMYELYFKTDLIGVTARQRVETPNLYFHPCEDTPFRLLKNNHAEMGDARPCWRCWAAFFLSPCPLQGFEFEATLIMNSAMFNLVEALPVMPGPCQLLNWRKMKRFKVVDEYFNLLFKGESTKKVPKLPKKFRSMSRPSSTSLPPNFKPTVMNVGGNPATTNPMIEEQKDVEAAIAPSKQSVNEVKEASMGGGGITFTEFLRVNMRLAEDRILSFVCVFSTGYGTKWIPGATFFYQPEICWESLLTQRRRWLNGTFASFLFFFNSQRAHARVLGGMFDSHKAGKNIRFINALWSLQLMQLILVLIAPAVFGSAIYIGSLDCANRWPAAFGWATMKAFGPIGGAEIWVSIFMLLYASWSIRSYYAPRGKMPELWCQILAVLGFCFMFPVYFAVWYEIFTKGVDLVDGLVIASLLLPIIIALAQSATSAALYCAYLPWFLFLILFFLVFIPSYSFARLWDTTWGNRATGKDSAISEKIENIMKFRNLVFVIGLVSMNMALAFAFVKIFRFGYNYVLAFMFIVFCPMIIQLICSFVFLFLVIPLRNLTSRPLEDGSKHNSVSTRDSNRSAMSMATISNDHHKNGSVVSSSNGRSTLTDVKDRENQPPPINGSPGVTKQKKNILKRGSGTGSVESNDGHTNDKNVKFEDGL